jgi:tRNA-splicing ligase RtcB
MRVILPTSGVPIKNWATGIEQGAIDQAINLAALPFTFKHVALMPDSHVGYGMPIGGVLATRGVIVPNAVGVDIGCGMVAMQTTIKQIDTETLKTVMGHVRNAVPTGFSHQKEAQAWEGFERAPELAIIQQELGAARKQLGTLGGGNHFLEFQQDEEGMLWVMIHSGSRNFGLKAAKCYHTQAQELCARWHVQLPDRDLAFLPLEDQAGQDYLMAINYCLEFARANRDLMMANVLRILQELTGTEELDRVNIHHNYARLESHYGENVMVHRKGATSAQIRERGIIPGSMGTSSYIVEGLGNPESFHSCSHGAGRRMGRKQAGRELNLEHEQARMAGIVHGLRSQADLDEAPGAYKDIEEVMENQVDLVRITVRLRPLGSIKG